MDMVPIINYGVGHGERAAIAVEWDMVNGQL